MIVFIFFSYPSSPAENASAAHGVAADAECHVK